MQMTAARLQGSTEVYGPTAIGLELGLGASTRARIRAIPLVRITISIAEIYPLSAQ